MKVALGLKAHSGWAALVALGHGGNRLQVLGRRRIELVENGGEWARQPYHAAEGLSRAEAEHVVRRSLQAARRCAVREISAEVNRLQETKHEVCACAVLVGDGMPDWSVEEILAVHFRMHKAEGVLFRDALMEAARECQLTLVAIPEKRLPEHAEQSLATPESRLLSEIAALGKSVGPPWGRDEKDAALAARIALEGSLK
ncbi:MAG: hypothetical protein HYY23_07980 [Verrucomicrobia bacterium]|nr:hypothetical protein [Verrucomicrobiota bacterium]